MGSSIIKKKPPREARKATDSTFDAIYKFYFNKENTYKLTTEEEAIRERWSHAWSGLCQMFGRRDVVQLLMKKFDVSQAQAYDDLANAERLFPVAQKKEVKRALAEEWILWAMKKAREQNDIEMVDRLSERYIKLHNLGSDDNEGGLPKDFKAVKVVINVSSEALGKEIDKLRGQIEAEDVDFESVE